MWGARVAPGFRARGQSEPASCEPSQWISGSLAPPHAPARRHVARARQTVAWPPGAQAFCSSKAPTRRPRCPRRSSKASAGALRLGPCSSQSSGWRSSWASSIWRSQGSNYAASGERNCTWAAKASRSDGGSSQPSSNHAGDQGPLLGAERGSALRGSVGAERVRDISSLHASRSQNRTGHHIKPSTACGEKPAPCPSRGARCAHSRPAPRRCRPR